MSTDHTPFLPDGGMGMKDTECVFSVSIDICDFVFGHCESSWKSDSPTFCEDVPGGTGLACITLEPLTIP